MQLARGGLPILKISPKFERNVTSRITRLTSNIYTYRTMMAGRTKESNGNRVAAHQQREMQKWGAIGEALNPRFKVRLTPEARRGLRTRSARGRN
jgi:hypothetical protein